MDGCRPAARRSSWWGQQADFPAWGKRMQRLTLLPQHLLKHPAEAAGLGEGMAAAVALRA